MIKSNFFNCYYLKNGISNVRLGIVVSKKIGNSVVRNYEKRTIREIFRKLIPTFKASFDLIFILKKSDIAFFEKEKVFIELIRQIEKRLL